MADVFVEEDQLNQTENYTYLGMVVFKRNGHETKISKYYQKC